MKCLSLIVLLLLSSCQTIGIPPKRFIDVERCIPNMVKTIEVDGEAFYAGYCSCHKYRVGDTLGRISETVKKPLLYCDKQAGFKDYATTLYLYLEEWRVFLLQQE